MASHEGQVVRTTSRPLTLHSLTEGLRAAGLERGETVLVHSSLSSMGWIVGGPVAEATGGVRVSGLGRAEVRLMRQRELVDFAVGWLEEKR